jgi:hypothetical protein
LVSDDEAPSLAAAPITALCNTEEGVGEKSAKEEKAS